MPYSILRDPAHPQFRGMRASTLLRHMAYQAEDTGAFRCLTQAEMDPARPLFVLVHPGDMIETFDAWSDPKEAQAVGAFWAHNAHGLHGELKAARKAGADIVVLHRESSTGFVDTRRLYSTAGTLWKTHLSPLFSKATALWGDDLDAAVAWLAAHATPMQRPSIHLAGAYACPKYGCLTAVGKGLLAQGVDPDHLTVSPYAPPGNGPGPVWRPSGVVEMDVPARIHEFYAALPAT